MDEKTIPLNKIPVEIKAQASGKNKLGANLDYRALFEQTGECVFIIGLDFKFITANQQALQLLGYDESQLLTMSVEDIMAMEDVPERRALLEKHLYRSASTLKKKDGTLLPVELSISVVHNEKGMPEYIQLLARDTSEQKLAESVLKRHIRALAVIGQATAGLFRSPNIQTTIPEVLESLGYAVDVFCCALFNIHTPELMDQYQWVDRESAGFNIVAALQPFLDVIEENPARVFSVTGVKIDSEKIPVISILVIPIQGAMGSWGFLALFDKENQLSWLTNEFDTIQTTANLIGAALERLRYEETIRISEMRNRIIVDALPDLLLRTDLEGYILDYNANPSHPLYVPRETVVGRKLQELWPLDVVKVILDSEDQDAFVSSHLAYGFSLPNHEQTFEARLHPISSGEALIIVRDVTEQARLDQMKSDFINRASHELRTPLTSAILMTELLQEGGTKEEKDEYLGVLMNELNRQKELINQLLLAGRLESGKIHLEAVPMDLMPVLKESMQAVKAIANKRNITITLAPEHESMQILGDVGGLSQVFINLINNAVKFSPAGKEVLVSALLDETDAVVSITDHGLGIPADSISHLFERFYRARNVTVAEIPGSGIGLYIVKSIVDELHGLISVVSEVNQGTTFTVRLRRGWV
ncbi:MAG: PAS domain S-box protein [Anaerolineales bacterium]|nr:PAS domain S-box protein [Anaerolineales bacterium]